MRFLKEGYKTTAKAIVSSVKKRWSWKWPDERLELPLETLDLSNTR